MLTVIYSPILPVGVVQGRFLVQVRDAAEAADATAGVVLRLRTPPATCRITSVRRGREAAATEVREAASPGVYDLALSGVNSLEVRWAFTPPSAVPRDLVNREALVCTVEPLGPDPAGPSRGTARQRVVVAWREAVSPADLEQCRHAMDPSLAEDVSALVAADRTAVPDCRGNCTLRRELRLLDAAVRAATSARRLGDIAVLDLLAQWTPGTQGRPTEWPCACGGARVESEAGLAERADLRNRIAVARDAFGACAEASGAAVRLLPHATGGP